MRASNSFIDILDVSEAAGEFDDEGKNSLALALKPNAVELLSRFGKVLPSVRTTLLGMNSWALASKLHVECEGRTLPQVTVEQSSSF